MVDWRGCFRTVRLHWRDGCAEGYPRCCVLCYCVLDQFTRAPFQVLAALLRRSEGEWEWVSEMQAHFGGFVECPFHIWWECFRRVGFWMRVQTDFEETPKGVRYRWRVFGHEGWQPWQYEDETS